MSDRLGEMLVQAKRVTEDQLRQALETQQQVGGKLGVILTKLRIINEDTLADFLGQQLNIRVLGIKELVVSPQVSALVDLEVLEKNEVLPLYMKDDKLVIAVSDPLDYNAIDELRFLTNHSLDLRLGTRSNITKAIDFYFHGRACKDLEDAETALRASGKHPAAASGSRLQANVGAIKASPLKVVQALVELLVEKKVITRDELATKLGQLK